MTDSNKPPRRRWPWMLAGSVLFVLTSPLLVIGTWFLIHAATFDGTCGPYAPDIPKAPCDYDTYLRNFFSFFAILGMGIVSVLTLVGSSLVVGSGWVIWLLVRLLRS